MKISRSVSIVLPLLFCLNAACDDKKPEGGTDAAPSASAAAVAPASASAAPSAAASASAKPDGERGGKGGFHGGATGMFFKAAKGLDLKDDKKAAIDKLEASVHPAGDDKAKMAGMRTEMKDLHTDLLAQVKAGKIEAAKLEPRLSAVEKSAQAAKDKEADALNGLHAALDATQRKAVVADIKAKMAQGHDRGEGHHGGHDAADGGATDGGANAKRGEEWSKRRLAKMTKDLDLDAAQQKKVEAILAKDTPAAQMGGDRSEMKKQMDALLDAFEKDTFDAKKLEGWSNAGKKGRAMIDHEVQFYAQLVPVLKPEQQQKLATSMETPPRMRGGMGGDTMMPPMMFEDDEER